MLEKKGLTHMKKILLKIKWKNVIKSLMLLVSVSFIIHDVYLLTISSWFTGELYSFTWFGFITFILFCTITGMIISDFEEQKSILNSRPKQSKNTYNHKYN